jgi:cell division protease FtsH
MVCEWGMSDKLGPIALGQKEEPIFIGKEIARHKDYSEETAQTIDGEIRRIVQSCLQDARRLLSDHREDLNMLAETLVQKETLDDAEVRALLGLPAAKRSSDSEDELAEG